MVDEIFFQPMRPIQPLEGGSPGAPSGAKESSFQNVLQETLREIDALQHRADGAIRGNFNPNDPTELHDVMIAMEEANIAFQFTMEVRNRLVDAYNEVMRMSV